MNDRTLSDILGLSLDSVPESVDIARMQNDMRNNLLSDIEDYCIIFGTNALPALRDFLSKATTGWTKRPDPALVGEDE